MAELTATTTTTCPEHRWTLPCVTCTHRDDLADRRLAQLWALGFTGTQHPTPKRIEVRSKRTPRRHA